MKVMEGKLMNQSSSATKGFGHVKKTEYVQYSISLYLSRDVVKSPLGTFHTYKVSS